MPKFLLNSKQHIAVNQLFSSLGTTQESFAHTILDALRSKSHGNKRLKLARYLVNLILNKEIDFTVFASERNNKKDLEELLKSYQDEREKQNQLLQLVAAQYKKYFLSIAKMRRNQTVTSIPHIKEALDKLKNQEIHMDERLKNFFTIPLIEKILQHYLIDNINWIFPITPYHDDDKIESNELLIMYLTIKKLNICLYRLERADEKHYFKFRSNKASVYLTVIGFNNKIFTENSDAVVNNAQILREIEQLEAEVINGLQGINETAEPPATSLGLSPESIADILPLLQEKYRKENNMLALSIIAQFYASYGTTEQEDKAEALFQLGLSYYSAPKSLNNNELAICCFTCVSCANPRDERAIILLGNIYCKRGLNYLGYGFWHQAAALGNRECWEKLITISGYLESPDAHTIRHLYEVSVQATNTQASHHPLIPDRDSYVESGLVQENAILSWQDSHDPENKTYQFQRLYTDSTDNNCFFNALGITRQYFSTVIWNHPDAACAKRLASYLFQLILDDQSTPILVANFVDKYSIVIAHLRKSYQDVTDCATHTKRWLQEELNNAIANIPEKDLFFLKHEINKMSDLSNKSECLDKITAAECEISRHEKEVEECLGNTQIIKDFLDMQLVHSYWMFETHQEQMVNFDVGNDLLKIYIENCNSPIHLRLFCLESEKCNCYFDYASPRENAQVVNVFHQGLHYERMATLSITSRNAQDDEKPVQSNKRKQGSSEDKHVGDNNSPLKKLKNDSSAKNISLTDSGLFSAKQNPTPSQVDDDEIEEVTVDEDNDIIFTISKVPY